MAGPAPVDLVIVGAGPAGSSAARQAATLGLDVLLLEKRSMPRVKPCGGALSERAIGYLGFPIPGSLVNWECYGARVHHRNRHIVGRLGERSAVLVSREHFDQFLVDRAQEAGAKFRLGEVMDLSHVDGGVRLRLRDGELTAKAAIVAQGATGSLIRKVRPADGKDASGICIESRFPVATPDRFSDLEGLIDIYFGVAKFGYGWVFHHGTYYSVGVGGLRSVFTEPAAAFRKFCSRLGFDSARSNPRSHTIPCGGLHRRLVTDRIALAGDSAGFVDAFYGEGIAYAIRSGQLAAETIARCLREGDLSEKRLGEYPARCKREFGTNLAYSLALSRLMHRAPGVFIRLLSSDPTVLTRFLNVSLAKTSYRSYLWWIALHAPWLLLKSCLMLTRSSNGNSRSRGFGGHRT
ncbi:MAG: geranylgeranyl reductase family protein [Planctomycetota bacterium]|jgi:geranylgeranyl reductase family protein